MVLRVRRPPGQRKARVKAPLTWFGGKSRGVQQIKAHFPQGLRELVSPFLGGGPLEVEMAKRRVRVWAYDIEANLACFWSHQLSQPEALFQAVKDIGQPTRYALQQAQKALPKMAYSLEKAAWYYVVNKNSWLGMTLNGSIVEPVRYIGRIRHDLRHFKLPNLSFERCDYRDALAKHPESFAYLDPPYFFEGNAPPVYGENGRLQIDFDHLELFARVKDRRRWIMSQQDNSRVRELYKGFKMVAPEWSYGGTAECRELLIFSKDLEPRKLSGG